MAKFTFTQILSDIGVCNSAGIFRTYTEAVYTKPIANKKHGQETQLIVLITSICNTANSKPGKYHKNSSVKGEQSVDR